uniref:ANK_REP_REGION domain-containing protein n=1 Tax=Panagrellus redivivus TaxID=6233 RepID=A0A7E4VG22_PANRE
MSATTQFSSDVPSAASDHPSDSHGSIPRSVPGHDAARRSGQYPDPHQHQPYDNLDNNAQQNRPNGTIPGGVPGMNHMNQHPQSQGSSRPINHHPSEEMPSTSTPPMPLQAQPPNPAIPPQAHSRSKQPPVAASTKNVYKGIPRFRRPVVVRTFYAPEGLPQYHPKAGTPRPVPSEVTPLHDALRRSVEPLGVITEDWMQLLSTIDILGQTPSHAAVDAVAEKPEAAIMADLDILIMPEYNIDQRDNAGNTALHLAIKCGRPEVVAYLLERGADPNAYGPHGTTPLSMAIMGESLECLKTLMKHKDITPNIAIVPEDTPLKMCIMRGPAFNAYIDVLLENPKTSVKAIGHLQTGICRSPIHVAVTARNLYALDQLIKRQANLTVKDRQKKTPLLLAIETGAVDIAKILIRNIKVNNFYEPNPLLSPIEQAKARKMTDVLKCMKEAALWPPPLLFV